MSEKRIQGKIKKIVHELPHKFRHIFTALLILCIIILIGLLPGVGFLRYYIDGYSIQRRDLFARTGVILWETPRPVACGINEKPDNFDAAISSDAKVLIFSHKYSENNRNLYASYFIDGKWTKAMPLREINSQYNEINPFLSYDDKYLFFSSDRPGGKGGYDIWCSVKKHGKWSKPYLLGGAVNSEYDELYPSLSPTGRKLFFSSDRPIKKRHSRVYEKKDSDIYVAKRFITKQNPKIPIPEDIDIPAFFDVRNVKELNTKFNEGRLVITGRGDLAYFSSDRPGGLGGFDIYKTHYFYNRFYKPENMGYPVNTVYDEISPTIIMEGFKLFFSSNRFARSKNDFKFYTTSARQVVAKIDYTVLIALLVILLTLFLTAYILHLLLTNVDMKTITKCLLLSILLHLLFLLLSGTWYIGEKISEAIQRGPENMTININNLARENIAVAIKEGIAALPKVREPISPTRPPDIPTPVSKTKINKSIKPIVKQTTVSNTRISPFSEIIPKQFDSASKVKSDIGKLLSLKPSLLGHSNITMEVPAGKSTRATGSSKGKSKGLPVSATIPQMNRIDVVNIKIPLLKNKFSSQKPVHPIAELTGENVNSKTLVPINIQAETVGENDIPDSLKKEINAKKIAFHAGKSSFGRDTGLLIMDFKLPLEVKKPKPKKIKEPKLDMLPPDETFYRLIKLHLNARLPKAVMLNIIYKMMRLKGFFPMTDFIPLDILFDTDSKLSDVRDLLYQNSPKFRIKPDTELEVPEEK